MELDNWLQPQMLRQEGDMDCGVAVFGALAELTREEILRDMPDAVNGKTVDEWKAYLSDKGFAVFQYSPDEPCPLPCAHLVGTPPNFCHWIYQAPDGGIHDPSPVFRYTPPKLINLSHYGGTKILTITIGPRGAGAVGSES